MGKFIDISGQKFGLLTVIEQAPSSTKHKKWKCVCDCGRNVIVTGNNLKSGNTKSCGCIDMANKLNKYCDLTGKQFGKLTVIKREGYQYGPNNRKRILWKCLCECGNVVVVKAEHLKNGSTKSCGCLKRELAKKRYTHDITGQRFGKLVVIRQDKTKKDRVYWKCKCDCGRYTSVVAVSLTRGLTRSCGCMKMSIGEMRLCKELEKHRVCYKREYSFFDLRTSKNFCMRFDFAIFDIHNNLMGLIEFQGEQHYRANIDDDFGKQQREVTDKLKREYCQKHNIKLIEIKYNDNIEFATLSAIIKLYANPVPSAIE